jgi:16S rRNA (adenine1518-N6/adenine1519-N6)-dimethyltransferase
MRDEKRKKIFAKKSFGQNFLTDLDFIDKIVSALNPKKDELVVEIGAGRGALTGKLLESGAFVCAIELDNDLIPVLRETFGRYENFAIVHEDALRIDFGRILEDFGQSPQIENKTALKLVANLPYNISTAILQRLIEQRACFSEMILMFQREVVERMTAPPGSSERGFLSVLVETYLDAIRLFDVSPHAFNPVPKVWSSVARLRPRENVEIADENLFRRLISAGFVQRRKTIFNNLKNSTAITPGKKIYAEKLLELSGIDAKRRAETLTVDEWKNLCRTILSGG